MFYRVIPFSRAFDTFGLVYEVPKNLEQDAIPWRIVSIPFRNTQGFWILSEKLQKKDVNCDIWDVKQIFSIVSDFCFLSSEQLRVIDFVSRHYITPIHNALNLYFPRNLLEKIEKETFHKIQASEYIYKEKPFSLTEQQNNIYNKILSWENNKHLIYWVTGSGKTQIYMKIIEDNLKQWKQTLLLIPEIILTSQIGERVKEMFGEDVLILHSWVSAAKKSKYWMDIYSGNAQIIIGTRSSLFYPYNKLWTIIIDEEHDQSYISDNAPRYHSLDVAEKLSELYNIPLILWSGTPRTTTFYRALQWEFQVLQLLEKYI